jgi:hypothetical protein
MGSRLPARVWHPFSKRMVQLYDWDKPSLIARGGGRRGPHRPPNSQRSSAADVLPPDRAVHVALEAIPVSAAAGAELALHWICTVRSAWRPAVADDVPVDPVRGGGAGRPEATAPTFRRWET